MNVNCLLLDFLGGIFAVCFFGVFLVLLNMLPNLTGKYYASFFPLTVVMIISVLSMQFNFGLGWLEYALHMIFQKADVIGLPQSDRATGKISKGTMGSIALLLYFGR